jgi:hypothetical protein
MAVAVPQVKQQLCHVCGTELLRRSEEKKDQRKKERLDAYYKKNFKVWQPSMPAAPPHASWQHWPRGSAGLPTVHGDW